MKKIITGIIILLCVPLYSQSKILMTTKTDTLKLMQDYFGKNDYGLIILNNNKKLDTISVIGSNLTAYKIIDFNFDSIPDLIYAEVDEGFLSFYLFVFSYTDGFFIMDKLQRFNLGINEKRYDEDMEFWGLIKIEQKTRKSIINVNYSKEFKDKKISIEYLENGLGIKNY